ncbi:FAD-dependent monooxygenase [Micromonospora globispora]|uniref:FAD-dependent monooxygenase n=1 Tax=Micromonospora globispora TaxID=1450148 RepID=UPI000F5D5FBD|nr:FAD-dependent monooxygenase [Micromonospora globispora]RQW88474.1 2-polyprenyl-6-methoxyphenol hydroxylase [Micromonospora globispora]
MNTPRPYEETDVIIVGGGPVGLTLAHVLGARGIRCVLLEPRQTPDINSPRCKQLNPRSMETFRTLGIAEDIRRHSRLPFGWSDRAVFATSLTGHLIERLDQVFALSDVPNSDLVEPAQWCGQDRVEEALRASLRRRDSVTALWGWTLRDIEQDAHGVTVTATASDGSERRIRGRYLAGADGSRSTVRRRLGIEMTGRGHEAQFVQAIFRAPGLSAAHSLGRAVQYWIVNERVSGMMGTLDTEDTWWAGFPGAPGDGSEERFRDAVAGLIGTDFPVTILATDTWSPRMLVADHYRAGRCFLLGDAAHLNPPWGGFGANLGIGDAADLGWKLAAAVSGWAGPDLLDCYEAERRPMAHRAIAEAVRNMQVLSGDLVQPGLEDDGPAGDRTRATAAAKIRRSKTAEMYTLGFVLGARYCDSPLVRYDDGPAPGSTTSHYQPSTAPGGRLPHLWLGPGRSLFDELGRGFTLVELGSTAGPEWETAAQERGLPLARLHLHRPDLAEIMGADFLLVRPDHHVAWRGSGHDLDVAELLDQVRGCARSSTSAGMPVTSVSPQAAPA